MRYFKRSPTDQISGKLLNLTRLYKNEIKIFIIISMADQTDYQTEFYWPKLRQTFKPNSAI
jgi:hypothetical protein